MLPPHLAAAMGIDTDHGLLACQQLLQGYSYLELPDLSADRLASNDVHVAALQLEIPHLGVPAAIVYAAGVLATYCATQDVLLAVQLTTDTPTHFVRVTWSEGQNWEQLIRDVTRALESSNDITLCTLRRVLDISEKQSPCIAMCDFTNSSSSDYPVTIRIDTFASTAEISASQKQLHPSMSTQILAQFAALARDAIAHPSKAINIASECLPVELKSVYERVSDDVLRATYPHLPLMRLATDYLSQRARILPRATAVRWYPDLSLDDEDLPFESMTYAVFDSKANQFARWLLRQGLQAEDRVAVCIKRDLHFHTAMMGIMRAGGCYVPIDPELPVERKAYIAKDAEARFVLTSREVSPPELFGSSTVYLDQQSIQEAISREDSKDPETASPDGLAFLLYTSGTTGNPKGCLLTHRGLAQAILALSSTAADVRMDDVTQGRYLAVASIAFDVHLAETIVPIALGMPLLSAPRSQLLEYLPLYVKMLDITHLGIVPSLIEATLNAAQEDGENADMVLRYIASGGEKMSDSILDKWANHPQVRLANFYGPSEATIGCCARYMSSSTPRANIGRPLANVSGYVVGPDMNILPRGGIGELVVEGPLVGRGYHGRPDLTKKVFLEWPKKGCWAYRTGDLVRMMPDSTIEILGRIDTQIKLRGVRIESEGISAIIRKAVPSSGNFSLDATTVLAKHPSIGSEQLVSFFTWDSSVSVTTRKSSKPALLSPPKGLLNSIRKVCDAELASYMRPSHLIPLSWLPLSSNGKTDTKMLVGMFTDLPIDALSELMAPDEEDAKESGPASELEKKVFEVLRRHTSLPLDNPYPGLNIFECGLDSMGIIRFASDLKEALGQCVSASDIMKAPTLSGIVSILDAVQSASNAEGTGNKSVSRFSSERREEVELMYRAEDIEELLPPFTVQEGVLARSAEDDTLYVQHVLLAVRESISLSGLQNAWDEIVKRHPILRTVFHFGRALVQVVLKPEVDKLQWNEKKTELSDKDEFAQWFLASVAPNTSKDINNSISQMPPLRLCAYSSPSAAFLAISIHHALYDGISLPVLIRDVERVYSRLDPTPCAVLPDILEHIANMDLQKARTYWTGYFEGFSWPTASIARESSAAFNRLVVPFKSSLLTLKAEATSRQVTLQALLTCAFARLLATHVYYSEDVAFGVIRSGRLLPVDNIKVAMCPMISLVPFRVNFREPVSSLETVQKGISAMVEYEQIPLSKVQNWVRPGEPLFETLFSVSIKVHSDSGIWDVVESEPPEADYPLSVEIVLDPTDDSLVAQVAWIGGDLTHDAVVGLMHDLEVVTLKLGVGNALDPLQSDSKALASSPTVYQSASNSTNSVDDDAALYVDPDVLNRLRGIVAEFLGVTEDALKDIASLISMGLDSIKAVGLARALRKEGYTVTSADLMKNATLRRLSIHISSSNAPEAQAQQIEHKRLFTNALDRLRNVLPAEHLKLASEDEVEVFPTTILQAGMLSQTIASDGRLYVHAFPVELSVNLDFDRLHAAWKEVINSFSILRTSFHFLPESGEWAQAVHSLDASDWLIDTFRSEDEYTQKLANFVASAKLPNEISFSKPPVWARLFHSDPRNSEMPSHFVLVLHHALYDGISIGNLLDALKSAYRGTQIRSITQFSDILSHFIYQEAHGTSFWLQRLRGYKRVPLPHQSTDEPVTSHVVIRDIILDKVQLTKILTDGDITLQCLGQAAWAKSLAELNGSSDVVFGHVIAGRSIPGAEDVIGPVLNTIPCRIRLQKDERNIDLLRWIHQANIDVMSWQQSSLRSIQKEMRVEGLWDSLFVFQPEDSPDADEAPLWKLDVVVDHDVKIQYPINLELYQNELGFTVKCACRSDYFSAQELEDVVKLFQLLLENIINTSFASVLDDLPEVTILLHSDSDLHNAEHAASQTLMAIPPALLTLLETVTKVPANLIRSDTPLVALGIDSITAIQVVSKCRHAGMKISAGDIVTSRTIGDVAAKIRQITRNDPGADRKRDVDIKLSADETAGVLARFGDSTNSIERVTIASSGMKWLLGAWQRSEGSRFHGSFCYRLPSDIDAGRLKDAWIALVKRHAILRSAFACADGYREPRIVIFNDSFAGETWAEELIESDFFFDSVVEKMKNLLSHPLPTTRPPTKAVLLRSSQDSCLVFHLHHFQYDAWSLQLLVHDLSLFYKGSKPVSCNDMSPFLELFSSNSEHFTVQEQYWKRTFPSQFTPVYFPSLLDAESIQIPAQQRTIVTVEAAIAKAALCEERARSLQVSLQAVFLASWARIQGIHTSSESSTFGLWQAGRTGAIDDIAKLAVPCMNVLPLYVPGSRDEDVIEISRRIQDDLRARSSVVAQSDLVKIHEWLGAKGRPLCNVFVNIVRVAPDVGTEGALLEPVKVPYFVPDAPSTEENPTIGRLSITDLVKDDLFIDIAALQSTNSILMSIDAAAHLMDVPTGEALVRRWAETVQEALGVC